MPSILLDVAMVAIIILLKAEARSSVVAAFLIPLLAVSHFAGSWRWWLVWVILILSVAAGAMNQAGSQEKPHRSIYAIIFTRITLLCGGATILFIYGRLEHRHRKHFESLLGGTRFGVSVLNLDGTIREWNPVQESQYAPPGAKEAYDKGLPCYHAFHGQEKPCKW